MAAPILHTSPVTANATATDTNPTTTSNLIFITILSGSHNGNNVTFNHNNAGSFIVNSASLTPLGRPNRTRIAGAVRTSRYPELKTIINSGIDLLPVAATIVPSSATSMNVTTAGSMNASASSSVDIHNTSCIEDKADAGSLPPTADTYNTDRVPIQYPLSHMPKRRGAYDQLTAAQRDRLRNGQTHIVRSGELLENDRVLCLVLEYCPGVELFDHILDRHVVLSSGATGIPESEAKKIFRSLLEAVYFLHHHNIAHCDLKLENILVTESTPPIVN
ncbi:hypothetical protein BASA83_006566 [Batrachochytrium salamandrivorans]|nr:hypothetical protein BASA83_006566 [Batrachochytrium salamandrivorans]